MKVTVIREIPRPLPQVVVKYVVELSPEEASVIALNWGETDPSNLGSLYANTMAAIAVAIIEEQRK